MNMTEVINGPLPDGVNVSSHNVVGNGPVDYSLTLSIERADILTGMTVICDAQTLPVMTDEAACPVATGTLHFAADILLYCVSTLKCFLSPLFFQNDIHQLSQQIHQAHQ